jgi:hypothetical protein
VAAAPASESVTLEGVHHHPEHGRLLNVHDPAKLRQRSGFGMICPKISRVTVADSGPPRTPASAACTSPLIQTGRWLCAR